MWIYWSARVLLHRAVLQIKMSTLLRISIYFPSYIVLIFFICIHENMSLLQKNNIKFSFILYEVIFDTLPWCFFSLLLPFLLCCSKKTRSHRKIYFSIFSLNINNFLWWKFSFHVNLMKFNQSKVSNGYKARLYCQKPNTNICFVVAFDTINELKNLSIMEINFRCFVHSTHPAFKMRHFA